MKFETPEQYLNQLPDDRKAVFEKLRGVILNHIPKGFSETMSYGMIAYVVSHSIYPDGYHCNRLEPLPFISVANQKNFISLYHMGIYTIPELLKWFEDEYPKHSSTKLDMGKSCIRFKKFDQIPFDLIGELCSKITVQNWINVYTTQLKK